MADSQASLLLRKQLKGKSLNNKGSPPIFDPKLSKQKTLKEMAQLALS
jgi:hypothetical protein